MISFLRRVGLAVLCMPSVACIPMATLPAPPPLERRLDLSLPDSPSTEGRGRLAIEASEPATVGRVVKTTQTLWCTTSSNSLIDCRRDATFVLPDDPGGNALVTIHTTSKEEVVPLCTAPCVVDVAPGGHKLTFVSTSDPERRSELVATAVAGRTTAVRHELGRKPVRFPGTWVAGNVVFGFGAVLAVAGAGVTAWGVGDALARDDYPGCAAGCTPNGTPTIVAGISLLGTGLVSLVGGYLLAMSDRPVSRPGSTTQWVHP